jgi:hypothetical protein
MYIANTKRETKMRFPLSIANNTGVEKIIAVQIKMRVLMTTSRQSPIFNIKNIMTAFIANK